MSRLLIAKISKPQGIHGEVKCHVLTDILAIFDGKVKDFYVNDRLMHADKVCYRQGAAYIKFSEINSRNDAENYREFEIKLDKEILSKFLGDKILVDDLIGMNLLDEKGEFVGQIVDYENYGAADILTVLEKSGEYQIPFIKQVFVQNGKNIYVKRKEYNENKI